MIDNHRIPIRRDNPQKHLLLCCSQSTLIQSSSGKYFQTPNEPWDSFIFNCFAENTYLAQVLGHRVMRWERRCSSTHVLQGSKWLYLHRTWTQNTCPLFCLVNFPWSWIVFKNLPTVVKHPKNRHFLSISTLAKNERKILNIPVRFNTLV